MSVELQRVEQAWRQLKSGLRVRPVYHRAVHRIHARIPLTVIALLLERMAEQPGYVAQHPRRSEGEPTCAIDRVEWDTVAGDRAASECI